MGKVCFQFINEQFLFGSRPPQLNMLRISRRQAHGFSVPAKQAKKATSLYAAAENPRRTQVRSKKANYGWKLIWV